MDKEQLAYEIYLRVYGDVDDKSFRARKQTEILDWLSNSDLDGTESIESIVADWLEYDAPEPEYDSDL